MNDTRALLGRTGLWGHLASLPAERLRPFAAHAAELGYDTLWVGDATARDPFAQLAALSGASRKMTLGTSVVNIFGRDAMAAKMGAMTLHELTGGRFALGLGVSHVHLVEKLRGHAYERPLSHMRAYLEAYRRLPYRGPTLAGEDGGPAQPPVLLAALRRRMLQLAASATEGALPFLVSAPRVAWMREVLDAAGPAGGVRPVLAVTVPVVVESDPGRARAAGRAWIEPYCRASNYQASLLEQGFDATDWQPPYSERLVDAIVAWGGGDRVRARLEEMHASGADHVAIIPLAPDGSAEHVPALEALAPRR